MLILRLWLGLQRLARAEKMCLSEINETDLVIYTSFISYNKTMNQSRERVQRVECFSPCEGLRNQNNECQCPSL